MLGTKGACLAASDGLLGHAVWCTDFKPVPGLHSIGGERALDALCYILCHLLASLAPIKFLRLSLANIDHLRGGKDCRRFGFGFVEDVWHRAIGLHQIEVAHLIHVMLLSLRAGLVNSKAVRANVLAGFAAVRFVQVLNALQQVVVHLHQLRVLRTQRFVFLESSILHLNQVADLVGQFGAFAYEILDLASHLILEFLKRFRQLAED